ncbi:MAG: hypothetical protein JWL74_1559 [Alphaproteobacteria bacterium]|jgi:hypothetical protein|nr:hypothetical protein [Alphaproteobacteria bacterium]
MAKTLSEFTINGAGDDNYLMRFATDDGETVEVTATFDQLDLIAEAIDDLLMADEENALEVTTEE